LEGRRDVTAAGGQKVRTEKREAGTCTAESVKFEFEYPFKLGVAGMC